MAVFLNMLNKDIAFYLGLPEEDIIAFLMGQGVGNETELCWRFS